MAERRDWTPTEEEVRKASESMINELLQKPNNLHMECARHWGQIQNEEYQFDERAKKIECYKNATVEDIKAMFDQAVFENS